MSEEKSIDDHLFTFKEIVVDLVTLEVKYDWEDLAWMLLCSLSPSCLTFRDTILYNRDILIVDSL